MFYETYPFSLPALPYAYDALEPYIDAETMHYHHDKHFKSYIDKLNAALEPYPALHDLTLKQLLRRDCCLPCEARCAIMQNAGGVYNHTMFFKMLAPPDTAVHEPDGVLLELIERDFVSFDYFKAMFSDRASELFGSGWTYLVLTQSGRLKIVNYPNQVTPISDGVQGIILLDVWEHAYYLKYKNERARYIDAFWDIVDFTPLDE